MEHHDQLRRADAVVELQRRGDGDTGTEFRQPGAFGVGDCVSKAEAARIGGRCKEVGGRVAVRGLGLR